MQSLCIFLQLPNTGYISGFQTFQCDAIKITCCICNSPDITTLKFLLVVLQSVDLFIELQILHGE